MLVTRRALGLTQTFCIKCKKQVTVKIIRDDGSHTELCDCGCTLYQYHLPDEFHKTAFFTKKFIPKRFYDPEKKATKLQGWELSFKNNKEILEK